MFERSKQRGVVVGVSAGGFWGVVWLVVQFGGLLWTSGAFWGICVNKLRLVVGHERLNWLWWVLLGCWLIESCRVGAVGLLVD